MTTAIQAVDLHGQRQFDDWQPAVERLLAEVETWCGQLGWATAREPSSNQPGVAGGDVPPGLSVSMPRDAELSFVPVASDGGGRVDMKAWPSLNRVRLVRDTSAGWQAVTDSNVRVRKPWDRDTFVEIATDLAEAS